MSNKKDSLREEYDPALIKSGARGKYAADYHSGSNIVRIDPDLRESFPDSASVNRALREYLENKRRASS